METLGKILLVLGGVSTVLGGLVFLLARFSPFGRLPGDFSFHRGGVSIYAPIVSFLLLSIALTVIINLVLRVFWK